MLAAGDGKKRTTILFDGNHLHVLDVKIVIIRPVRESSGDGNCCSSCSLTSVPDNILKLLCHHSR